MLTVHQVSKNYGVQPILQDVSFSIGSRERLGLIGPNGCGKTTLMRILAGVESPDSGTVTYTPSSLRVGYLAQGADFEREATIRSAAGIEYDAGEAPASEVERLASALSEHPTDPGLQSEYDRAVQRLFASGNQWSALLAFLGLSSFPLETPVDQLSGGQKRALCWPARC